VVDVVLKMDVVGGRRPVLLKEASIYKGDGRAIQGDMLPVFYGCFEVQIEFTTVTCLVLEYCGEPMEKPFRDTELAFLNEILLALRAMHRQGITHGDLHPRNILNCNGQPVFVDLELAKLGHKCGTRIKLVPRALVPSVQEYGCAEMHDLI
ncbi:kinase-like domain-containing protein, partial [Roridomyces roridus]